MSDIEDAAVPELAADAAPRQTTAPPIEEQISALEAERSKVSSKTSFNLLRGLEGGIPTGTFFILGSVAFLVLNTLRHGLDWVYILSALVLFCIGLLLYVLSCWSRWRREEKKRLSLLLVLDEQIERKRDELRRRGETSSG